MANENNEQKRYRRPAGTIYMQAALALHGAHDRGRLAVIKSWDGLTDTERQAITAAIVAECLDSSNPDGAPSKFRDIEDAFPDASRLRTAIAVGAAMGRTPTDMVRDASEWTAKHDAAAAAFNAERDAKLAAAPVVTDATAVDGNDATPPQDTAAAPVKRGPGRPPKSTTVGASA